MGNKLRASGEPGNPAACVMTAIEALPRRSARQRGVESPAALRPHDDHSARGGQGPPEAPVRPGSRQTRSLPRPSDAIGKAQRR